MTTAGYGSTMTNQEIWGGQGDAFLLHVPKVESLAPHGPTGTDSGLSTARCSLQANTNKKVISKINWARESVES